MNGLRKEESIRDLKAMIAALEQRPGLQAAPERDAAPVLGAPAGLLHDVFADEMRHGAAALGFVLGQARSLVTARRPAVLMLQLVHESQEAGIPYGAGLASLGFDPDRLILGRLQSLPDLLWACEEALACPAVAAVVAELGAPNRLFDFTASRRLGLGAAQAGASAFLLRYGREREASAAALRWHVEPAGSGAAPFDARAPGPPRWRVRLEKGRLGPAQDEAGWLLGWTGDGLERIEDEAGSGAGPAARPAAPGSAPAALGDRLSQTA